MNRRLGRAIKSLDERRLKLHMVFICGLMAALSGCSFVVMQTDYQEDKQQSQKEVGAIRSQLLAHTQILANHGKSLNEFKLQLRDTVSNIEKAVKELKAKPAQAMVSPKSEHNKESTAKSANQSEMHAGTRYIRRTYRGLFLSYAGGYDKPRGSRYPFQLKPGTRVFVISGDRRGFTRVEVKSGRWEGKKMWVRTRWLTEQAPNHKDGKS